MKYNIRWIVLALIIVASFVAYLLRSNMSIIGATMSTDLGLTEIHLGMLFSAFAAGYAIFQFPGGVLSTRFGARLVIGLVLLSSGILTVLTAFVPGPGVLSVGVILGSLIVMRFLVGATQAPFFPCVAGAAIANWFPHGGWGVPNGLSSTGLTLGAAATAPLLVWLMDSVGWRGALLVTAPSAFILAAIWWWYVRDYPKEHDSVTRRELELIDADRVTAEMEEKQGDWMLVLKNRDVLLMTFSYFCMNYVFYLFFNWFFYYLTEIKGFSAGEAGILNASLWILGAVGATAGGFACDSLIKRLGFRWGPAVINSVGLCLCGVLLFVGALLENPYIAVVLFCLCFGLTQLTEAGFWATSISVGGQYAAAAGGVLNTGGNVVGFIGGMLVPMTAQMMGWTAAIATGSVFAIIGGVLWLFIRGDKPMIEPQNESVLSPATS